MTAQPIEARADLSGVGRRRDGGLNKRQLARASTRQRLRDAARFLFVNVGYEAATIRDMARRMGMSTGAVFSQVTDKAALWREVMGVPVPTDRTEEEAMLLLATRPAWSWLVRKNGDQYVALIQTPDYAPVGGRGAAYSGRAASPGSALREARLNADRMRGENTVLG